VAVSSATCRRLSLPCNTRGRQEEHAKQQVTHVAFDEYTTGCEPCVRQPNSKAATHGGSKGWTPPPAPTCDSRLAAGVCCLPPPPHLAAQVVGQGVADAAGVQELAVARACMAQHRSQLVMTETVQAACQLATTLVRKLPYPWERRTRSQITAGHGLGINQGVPHLAGPPATSRRRRPPRRPGGWSLAGCSCPRRPPRRCPPPCRSSAAPLSLHR
jgi:hypothetical protein